MRKWECGSGKWEFGRGIAEGGNAEKPNANFLTGNILVIDRAAFMPS